MNHPHTRPTHRDLPAPQDSPTRPKSARVPQRDAAAEWPGAADGTRHVDEQLANGLREPVRAGGENLPLDGALSPFATLKPSGLEAALEAELETTHLEADELAQDQEVWRIQWPWTVQDGPRGVAALWGEDVLVAGIQPVPIPPSAPLGAGAAPVAPSLGSTPASVTPQPSVSEPAAASSPAGGSADGFSPVWLAGLALFGAGGGGGGGSPAVATPATPAEPVVRYTISGTISMGQVLNAQDLTLQVFKAYGTPLGASATVSDDGHFSIDVTEAYSGVIMLRLKDADASANYTDEATGLPTDLSIDLRAMLSVSGSSDVVSALNPLTELAVRKWTGDSGGDGGSTAVTLGATASPAAVTALNTAVAKAFGLNGSVADVVPVTVDDAAFASAGSDAQAYGRVLAAMSGMQANAAVSTDSTLDALAAGLVLNGSTGSLSPSLVEALVLGAAIADAVPGNAGGSAAALNGALDGVGPKVTGISVQTLDSTPLALGERVLANVQFDDEVVVDTQNGSPELLLTVHLSSGDQLVKASYSGGSGSATLTFVYAIDQAGIAGDQLTVSLAANALQAGGASLTDVLGNASDLSHAPVAATQAFALDTVAPVISQIAATSASGMQGGWLNAQDTVTLTVGFSEAVRVDSSQGTPALQVRVGEQTVLAPWAGLSATGTEATFVLTLGGGQLDVDGISLGANALMLNGAQWTDVAGNPLNLASLAVAPNPTYRVDAVAPAASSRPDLLALDDTGVSNSDNITSTTQGLTFTGVAEANARVLVFDDANGNGVWDSGETYAQDLELVGGAWQVDLNLGAGSHAIRALVTDTAGNISTTASAAADVVVDAVAPTLQSFSSAAEAGDYGAGSVLSLTATASEALAPGGRLLVTLASGEQVVLMAQGDSRYLTGAYTVTDTGYAGDLAVVSYAEVPLVPVMDLAGRALTRTELGSDANQVANIATGTVRIDTVAPVVQQVSLASAVGAQGQWLNAGDVLTIDVRMSEVVFVGSSATPTLALTLDAVGPDSSGLAQYVGGSGSDTLRFAYTVTEGDRALGGVGVAQNGLALHLATVRDAAGNDALLDLATVPADGDYRIQTVAPVIEAVAMSDQAMVVGDTVQLTLTVSDDGGRAYTGIQGQVGGFAVGNLVRVDATTYTASFSIAEGGADVAAAEDITLSLRLVDVAGNVGAAFVQPVVGAWDGIDAHTPRLLNIAQASATEQLMNGTLSEGDTLALALTFSEAVVLSGTPVLPVGVGDSTQPLTYLSGSGSSTLLFGRTVLPGETDVDGISYLANALSLNGGRIVDAAGQDAILSHSAMASGGYTVDTTAPVVTAFYTDKSGGPYKSGTQIDVFAQMSEPVTAASELLVTLNTGATVTLRPMDSAGLRLRGTYTVATGENTGALSVAGMAVAGVYDLAGNVIIEGDLPDLNLPNSEAHQATPGLVIIDTVAPTRPDALQLAAISDSGIAASGSSTSDGITTLTSGLLVSTAVEAGATVRLYDGSLLLSTDVASPSAWQRSLSLAEGVHLLRVTATDAAGNVSAASTDLTLVVDTTGPSVSSVEVVAGAGAQGQRLNAGDTVEVALGMSEATWVDTSAGGALPSLLLDVGGASLLATYQGGSGSNTLRFAATIGDALNDADGVHVQADSLSAGGASFTDVAGNAAVLAHAAAVESSSAVLVDNTAPVVLGVSLADKHSNAQGLLVWQDTVYADVTFSEGVSVASGATPALSLNVGGQNVQAQYVSGSGSAVLRFAYVVGAPMSDPNGISVPAGNLIADVGAITDLAGNALGASSYAGLSDNANFMVDATPPTVSSLVFLGATGMEDGVINAGDALRWQVNLSEVVNIAGTPTLLLDVGGQSAYARYVQDSDTQHLVFEITFAPGYEDLDGVSIAANSLEAANGVLTDAQGNAVDLRHAALPALAAYPVDTLAPHVLRIDSGTPDGWYKAGETIQISAVFNEALARTAAIKVVLNTGESISLSNWDNGDTLSGSYTISAGSNSVDLAVTRITIDEAPVDVHGNTMSVQGDVQNLGLINLDVGHAIVVDTLAPAQPPKADLDHFSDTGISVTDNHTKVANGASFSGTAEAGAQVEVFADANNNGTIEGGELLGTVTADASGHWSFVHDLLEGVYDIRTRATDRAGNIGSASEVLHVSVDTTQPVVTDVALPDGPMKVGDEVVLTITVGPDVEDRYYNVQGSINGFAVGKLTYSGVNTYTATFTVAEGGLDALGSSDLSLVDFSLEDSAGNRSEVFTKNFVQGADAIDANSPKVIAVAISGGDLMQNAYLNAGDTVYVTVTMGEATVVTGQPQLQLNIGADTVLANYVAADSDALHLVFAYTIVDENTAAGIAIPDNAIVLPTGASLKDAAGNTALLAQAAVAANAAYRVDTVAPDQPAVVDLASADDAGVSDQDNITNAAGAVRVSGTAEAAARVILFNDADGNGLVDFGETTVVVGADGAGHWNAVLSLDAGNYAWRVIAEDAAGNQSLASEPLSLVLDRLAPNVTQVALGESVGLLNAYLNAGDQALIVLTLDEPVVVNTAGGTPTITLNIGGTEVYARYLSGSESQQLVFAYTVVNGQNDSNGISVVANSLRFNGGLITDVAGNAVGSVHAGVTNDASQMVDTLAPVKPSQPALATDDDSGRSATDAITSQTAALTFSGSGETGATLVLFADGNNDGVFDASETLGTTSITAGLWALDVNLSEGVYAVRAAVVDAAGNISVASDVQSVRVDETPPPQPGALVLVSADDTGRSISDGITQAVSGLRFGVTAEAGATLALFEGATELATTVVNGQLQLHDDLSEGDHDLFVVATDAAGNVSVDGVLTRITVDTTAPGQPSAIQLAVADDLGFSDGDLLTSQSSALSLSGTAEDGSSVDIYDDLNGDGVLVASEKLANVLAVDGAWGSDVSLTEGVHRLRVKATDVAGNTSAASEALVLSIDLTDPAAQSVQAWDTAGAVGYSRGDVLQLVFSEAVQASTVGLDQWQLNNGHHLGAGAVLQAQDTGGLSAVYWLTLGEAPTLSAGDVLSLAAAQVIDAAGNATAQALEFVVPEPVAGVVKIATTAGAERVDGTGFSDQLVAVGQTVSGQYSAADAVLANSAVVNAITRANTLSAVNLGDAFNGGAGFDVLSLYGTADLQLGVSLSGIERLQVFGDVALTTTQVNQLNQEGIAIDGAGVGMVRILADGVTNVADLSRLRISNLALLEVGDGVTAVLSQDNLDHIAGVATGWRNSAVQASVGSLDWAGVTVFGGADALNASGENLGALALQASALDGGTALSTINTSLATANGYLSSALSGYTHAEVVAADLDAVLWGQGDVAHDLVAFGAARHWLVGAGGADTLIAGSGGDVIWGGTELQQVSGVVNVVQGGVGADIVVTGSNADTISTGAGDDYIDAGAGVDDIRAGAGNDYIRSGTGTDTIRFESSLAANGVDLFDGNVVGDIFNFSAVLADGGFLGLTTEGSNSVWTTTIAGLSSLASHSAAFIVLTDPALGDGEALRALLNNTKFDEVDKESPRVVVWANDQSMVDMAFVKNTDSLNDDSVTVETFAHLMMTTTLTNTTFLEGLSDAHFVV